LLDGLCTCGQILRRSLSNIKDCSTAGSESNGPTEFTSSHRVVPPVNVVPGTDAARRPSEAASVRIASAQAYTAGRPRIARRPLNDTVPERPTTSRTTQAEAVSARPQRRSGSLDSKRSATRHYQDLSASALLTESTSMILQYILTFIYSTITSQPQCCPTRIIIIITSRVRPPNGGRRSQ